MALDFRMMQLKKVITKENYFGEVKTVTDLTEPTLLPNFGSTKFEIERLVVVTPEYVMRPDLISFWAYGVDSYADIIMKCNGISNPFSLQEGDLIMIPQLENFKSFYKRPKPTKKEIEQVKRAFIDKNRYSKPTEERLKKLQALANSRKNGSPTITPSNKLKPGESAVSRKSGALIFADYKSKQTKTSIKAGVEIKNNRDQALQ